MTTAFIQLLEFSGYLLLPIIKFLLLINNYIRTIMFFQQPHKQFKHISHLLQLWFSSLHFIYHPLFPKTFHFHIFFFSLKTSLPSSLLSPPVFLSLHYVYHPEYCKSFRTRKKILIFRNKSKYQDFCCFTTVSGMGCQQHLMKPLKNIGLNLVMLTRQRPLPWSLSIVATDWAKDHEGFIKRFQCRKRHRFVATLMV